MSTYCLRPIFSRKVKIQILEACSGARANQIAPFLGLDQDPYAVVSEGKLYWIQDAYTFSITILTPALTPPPLSEG